MAAKGQTTLSPSSARVSQGQTYKFLLKVDNSLTPSSAGVRWSVWPRYGAIANTGVYTAPAIVKTQQTIWVAVAVIPASSKVKPVVVYSAVTLVPPSSASFKGLDTKTQGNWDKNYGRDGYSIANSNSKVPSYSKLVLTGDTAYTWANPSLDLRALHVAPGVATRIASTYAGKVFTIAINCKDGQPHTVSLYLLDFDGEPRSETISVLDGGSGAILTSMDFRNFNSGEYASWTVTGNIIFKVTQTSSSFAVVSAIFFN